MKESLKRSSSSSRTAARVPDMHPGKGVPVMFPGKAFLAGICARFLPLVTLAALPGIAAGQELTPGHHGSGHEAIRAEYLSNVMRGLDPSRTEWSVAVHEDRLESLVKLYTEDAVIIPPDGIPLIGRKAIREFWRAVLPRIGFFDSGLTEMDARGDMAMVAGDYSLESLQDGAPPIPTSGAMLTVYVQSGHRWLIRAQAFEGQAPEHTGQPAAPESP